MRVSVVGALAFALALCAVVTATATDIDTESGIDMASGTVVEELSVDDAAGLIEDVEAEDEEIELSLASEDGEASEDSEDSESADEEAAEEESQAEEAAEEEEDAALIESDAVPAPKLKNTAEPSYLGKPKAPVVYHQSIEYGDPNPAKTAALAKAALKSGAPAHPTVFKTSFLTPLPTPKQHIRCYGKPGSDKEKCYRVDRKTGVVVGRQNKESKYIVASAAIETPSGHVMHKKGFQEPEYDDKLAAWKPRKHKRSLSAAPIVSLIELSDEDLKADADEQAEAGTELATEADEASAFVETERKKKKKKAAPVKPKSAFGWKKSARKNAKCACQLLQRHNSNEVKACKRQCKKIGAGCNAVNYNSVTAICDLRRCDADAETGAVKLLKTSAPATQCYWHVKAPPAATVAAAPTPAVVKKF